MVQNIQLKFYIGAIALFKAVAAFLAVCGNLVGEFGVVGADFDACVFEVVLVATGVFAH